MTLKGDMLADVDSVFFNSDEMAETITYTSDGTDKNISALIEIGTSSGEKWNLKERDRSYSDATFTIKQSDIPKPHAGDKILYNGKKYTFVTIDQYINGMYDLRFASKESAVSMGRLS
ncbi:head-tail joining protein [Pectinatus frisingensis]|uniref:head-tail joining protein n=1 Tax=Pectinatus frisingensis TaxID=865 RepID=UPI0018C588AF|nr:hypothetical protein [Pectinatus frisingensis]